MLQINCSTSYSVVSVFQSNIKDLPTRYMMHLNFPSSPGKRCYSTIFVQYTVYVAQNFLNSNPSVIVVIAVKQVTELVRTFFKENHPRCACKTYIC